MNLKTGTGQDSSGKSFPVFQKRTLQMQMQYSIPVYPV
jgi:hypothetical protein